MTKQLTVKAERERELIRENDELLIDFQTHLTKIELKSERRLHEQLEEKEKQVANFQGRMREMERQLTENEEQKEKLQTQLKEMDERLTEKETIETEQVANIQRLLREMEQQLMEKEEKKENLQTQLREMAQRLTENETRETEQVANIQRQLRDMEQQLTEKEEREENLQTQLKEMEQRLTEKETRETGLREQLRERDQREANFEGRMRKMEKRITEKEEREENLKTQLRKTVQRLTEKATIETGLREQLRERDQREANIQRHLREMERQVTEKEEREDNLQTQLREMEQQVTEKEEREDNLQTQLREMERQMTEKEEREDNLQTQLREMATEKETRETGLLEQLRERDQQVANFERQLGVWGQREVENDILRQQVAYLESRVGSESHDWVIPRDEIQMTDKSLGVGGWAEVFEGRYCGCAVAVKRIHEAIISPHNQGLFQRETDIASRCRHPCLLQFIGATNDEEITLFVTELMESNLRQLLEERQRQQRRLSKTEITVISLDVARALNYLHQKKPNPIIHRDVSSANVLLWRQGDRWRGKVSDYGTAKFEEQFMSIGPGCFAYSAPEVQRSSNQTAKVRINLNSV